MKPKEEMDRALKKLLKLRDVDEDDFDENLKAILEVYTKKVIT